MLHLFLSGRRLVLGQAPHSFQKFLPLTYGIWMLDFCDLTFLSLVSILVLAHQILHRHWRPQILMIIF